MSSASQRAFVSIQRQDERFSFETFLFDKISGLGQQEQRKIQAVQQQCLEIFSNSPISEMLWTCKAPKWEVLTHWLTQLRLLDNYSPEPRQNPITCGNVSLPLPRDAVHLAACRNWVTYMASSGTILSELGFPDRLKSCRGNDDCLGTMQQ